MLLPAFAMLHVFRPGLLNWIVSFVLALVWANWFEYFYHRWLDHTPGMYFEAKHRVHHAKPNSEEHTNLGDKPIMTAGMFVVNWIPVLIADLFLHWGFSGPVLVGFVFYVLVMEEVHWRAHHGGWIPASWREYHLNHHKRPLTKFNIFVPIFDWLFGTIS